ncbi:MAG: VOC family protein [Prochlorotrichaceae cyanobacterium]|jgi:catechol 2,3-dioxygenase-like lactoylglutathione lyase family enzyme
MISGFLHAALVVTDLERSAWFYGTVLNLPPLDRPLSFPGLWFGVGTVQLHLMAQDQVVDDRLNLHKWGRNRHLAFAVDDLEACQAQLEQHGCPVQRSASGRSALFTQDPDGNIIELSSP